MGSNHKSVRNFMNSEYFSFQFTVPCGPSMLVLHSGDLSCLSKRQNNLYFQTYFTTVFQCWNYQQFGLSAWNGHGGLLAATWDINSKLVSPFGLVKLIRNNLYLGIRRFQLEFTNISWHQRLVPKNCDWCFLMLFLKEFDFRKWAKKIVCD